MIFEDINQFIFAIPPKGRLIGIDFGEKKVGVAISDYSRFISTPLEVVKGKSQEIILKYLTDIIKEHEVKAVIIGLPMNMKGEEGEISKKVRAFALKLNITTFLQDERLSTQSANRILAETDYTRRKKEEIDDKISASIILQQFLDRMKYICSEK